MKKKILALVLCAVMCIGMTTVVYAANSPSVDNGTEEGANSPSIDNSGTNSPSTDNSTDDKEDVDNNGEADNKDEAGNKEETADKEEAVTATVVKGFDTKNCTEEQKEAIEEYEKLVTDETSHVEIIKKLVNVEVKYVVSATTVDVVCPENITKEELAAGVNIEFAAPEIKAGDSILVLHLKDNGEWEVITATAKDGSIVGKFTSLSPVVYYKLSETSPYTGESNANMIIALVALVALAGTTAYAAKRKLIFCR